MEATYLSVLTAKHKPLKIWSIAYTSASCIHNYIIYIQVS